MTIQSSIKELGLFDLFQILHLHHKTGRLIITDGPDEKEAQILFQEGMACFAIIHEKSPKSIESVLMEWGVLDDESSGRIEKALPKHGSLLDCLAHEGISSRTHLENFISARVRECIYEIFKWDKGECRFIEETLDPRRDLIVPLNTENLILEGARRIDEWSNIRSKVPSRQSIFRICPENKETQQINLKPREWEILALIDGNRTVNEVNEVVEGDLFSTSKLIYGLVVMGVIELVDDELDGSTDINSEERLQELLRSGKEYYDRLNLEKAATEFEKTLQIDPDCFEALRMLGEIYYKMDRLSESLVYLHKARTHRPENQKTMFIKGYLHARLGEIPQAVKEWEELKEKSSNPKIVELVKKRIEVAREWGKILQEY
ncbi:MAG: DUF4388 domain-containing protein [bacterium]|nr:MAG: DUF4388 domain-containing protein [bacterium]